MRITMRTLYDGALTDLTAAQQRLSTLQNKLTTGKELQKPSDDPAAMSRALAIREDVTRTTQFIRNVDAGVARLGATEAALGSLTEITQRARELAISAGNDTISNTQRQQIAQEVAGLLEETITLSNTKFAGQFLFAGHKSTTAPFTPVGAPPTAVTYNGDSGAVDRSISIGVRVTVNVPGDQVFGPAFQALIDLRDDLLTGDANAIRLTDVAALDGVLDSTLTARGGLGATANRLELTGGRLDDSEIASRQQLAEIEDVDIIGAIVDMNAQQATLEAAMRTMASSVQVSLLDFLR